MWIRNRHGDLRLPSESDADGCSRPPVNGMKRRAWFETVAGGICGAAMHQLMAADGLGGADEALLIPSDFATRQPHFPTKAKSVIQLFMNGGPSQMDLFDPKPGLDKYHGKSLFDKIAGEVENISAAGSVLRSPVKFSQCGASGAWYSELLPHLSKHADDIAVLKGMFTTNLTHEPALYLIHTGHAPTGHPVMGSWIVYGLGNENQNLPAYVVLDDPEGLPVNGVESWSAGFLPPLFQGTRFRSKGDPVLNLHPEKPDSPKLARVAKDFLARLDSGHRSRRPFQPSLEARISSYELAARMQLAAGEALSFEQESASVLESYGIGKPSTDSYGRRCLMARRLVERGVRFVQVFINGQIWDHHNAIDSGLKSACLKTDQPAAALLSDLKQRGLLDSTLVVWGGEFGRLPIAQLPDDKNEKNAGRDHNKNAFSTWMAGAGVKGGSVFGATDELGMSSVEGRVSVPDWHATILHLMGLNYEKLFFPRNGLRERLTGVVDARVVKEILV